MAGTDDDDHAISYLALKRGVPVHASDGEQVGTVHRVQDNAREHIFDGIVIATPSGRRFVDAPEVARITERRVTLTIDAAAVEALPEDSGKPGPPQAERAMAPLAARSVACGRWTPTSPSSASARCGSTWRARSSPRSSAASSTPGGWRAAPRTASRGPSSSIRDDAAVEGVAESVFEPLNIRGAAFLVAIVDERRARASTPAARRRT